MTNGTNAGRRMIAGLAIAAMAGAAGAGMMWAGVGAAMAHDDHHQHAESYAAGEPGQARKPARLIEIVMAEGDGKMMYEPARLEIKKGEQVKFVLRNRGELLHEIVLGTAQENLEHGEEMKKHSDMPHGDLPNAKHIEPGKSGELLWKFTKAGVFEYACLIPGHREAGMVGTIVVK